MGRGLTYAFPGGVTYIKLLSANRLSAVVWMPPAPVDCRTISIPTQLGNGCTEEKELRNNIYDASSPRVVRSGLTARGDKQEGQHGTEARCTPFS